MRPRKHSAEEIAEIKELFGQYVETTDIPIVAEFAYMHDITRQTLYDYDEFSTVLKKCIDKKEAQLERKSLTGEVNTTQAIFSLKQLGWKDKQETNINLNVNELSDEEINELLKED